MFLKQILINNFCSFESSGESVNFGPHLNVIVGRNGSGKSNLFRAIEFVVSDEFNNVRKEEKLGLMRTNMSPRDKTSVELVLTTAVDETNDGEEDGDNDDEEAKKKNEFRIKRLLSEDRDQYFLDDKPAPRNQVFGILEGNGFFLSNPYYIVKQNKVAEIALARDSERLSIFYDAIGVNYFDKRRKEADTLIAGSDEKIERIKQNIDFIDKNLKSFESEKENLMEYLKMEADKNYMELAHLESKTTEIEAKLNGLYSQRCEITDSAEKANKRFMKLSSTIEQKERQISALNTQMKLTEDENRKLQEDAVPRLEEFYRIQTEIESVRAKLKDEKLETIEEDVSKIACTENMELVNREISELTDQLLKLDNQKSLKLCELKHMRSRAQIIDDSGLTTSVSTPEVWKKQLAKEIKKQNSAKNANQLKIGRFHKDLERLKKQLTDKQTLTKAMDKSAEGISARIGDWVSEIGKHQRVHLKLTDQRQSLVRRENKLKVEIGDLQKEIELCSNKLRNSIGHNLLKGMINMERMIDEFKSTNVHPELIDGYKGVLIDLISVEKVLYAAVENTARNRLFNHVVDNEQTATKLIELFNSRKLDGVINFTLISRAKPPVNFANLSAICRQSKYLKFPVASKIEYSTEIENVVFQTFGTFIVTSNLFMGMTEAKEHRVNCVSIDGDKMTKPGFVSGGFNDPRKSVIATHLRYRQNVYELRKLERELDEAVAEKLEFDAKLNECNCRMNDSIAKRSAERSKLDGVNKERRKLAVEEDELKEKLAEIEQQLKCVEASNVRLDSVIDLLNSEMTDEKGDVSSRMASVSSEIQSISVEKENLERRMSLLKGYLNDLRQGGGGDGGLVDDGISMPELIELRIELREMEEKERFMDEWVKNHENMKDSLNRLVELHRAKANSLSGELDGLKSEEKDIDEEINRTSEVLANKDYR